MCTFIKYKEKWKWIATFYMNLWSLFRSVTEITTRQQRAESGPPTTAHEQVNRLCTHQFCRWTCEISDRDEVSSWTATCKFSRSPTSRVPNLKRPSQHTDTSAGEVTGSFPSQNHEHDGCFWRPRLFFFSLCGFFPEWPSSTSPLSSDLSTSYLPSTAPSSFPSTFHLLTAQTSPSVSLLGLIGLVT